MLTLPALSVAIADNYVPKPQPCRSELIVGSYYFPGHFDPMCWMPFKRAGFPNPILGHYRDGEPEVMDWHIKWAVEYGIEFFAFDWYYHYLHGPATLHNQALDKGLLNARYRDYMKFCLMWCNEHKDERYNEEHMMTLSHVLTDQYFCQPNYLRIDGANVLIVSMPAYLLTSFGCEGTAQILERMAEIPRKAGFGGIFAIAKGHRRQEKLKQAGFRAITGYNYPDAGMSEAQKRGKRGQYSDMVVGYEEVWNEATTDGTLPYSVPICPEWDSRPWHQDPALARTNPRPRLFYEMCLAAKQYTHPKLGMVIAKCWDEFGEGSYLELTAQYGFGFLDAMRDAFCEQNPLMWT